MKLNALDLRNLEEDVEIPEIKRNPIYLILDNIYDTYNIGGIFRLADALACERIYLCGTSETPPNSRIKKASIGTYKVVPWTYKKTTLEAIEELKKTVPGITTYAVEQSDNSINYMEAPYTSPMALILGNETSGCSQEVLDAVDQIVEIPMYGINISLNVIVSGAIVAYHSIRFIKNADNKKAPPNKE